MDINILTHENTNLVHIIIHTKCSHMILIHLLPFELGRRAHTPNYVSIAQAYKQTAQYHI